MRFRNISYAFSAYNEYQNTFKYVWSDKISVFLKCAYASKDSIWKLLQKISSDYSQKIKDNV